MEEIKNKRVWMMALSATLGSLIFGYNIGLGASKNYSDAPDLFEAIHEVIMPFGALIGSVTSPIFADRLGRRVSLLIYDGIVILASVLIFVPSHWIFGLSRLISGVATGGFSCVVLHYLREMCPLRVFPIIVPLVQVQITIGVLVVYIFFTLEQDRLVYILQAVPAVCQIVLLTLVFREDTPYFYWATGRPEAAQRVLSEIYKTSLIDELVTHTDLDTGDKLIKLGDSYFAFDTEVSYLDLIKCKFMNAKMMRNGICLNVIQQVIGINAILFTRWDDYIESILGFVNMCGAVVSVAASRFVGQKTLLLSGNCGIAIVSMVVFTWGLFFPFDKLNPILAGLFIASFELGMGPVCWNYCALTLSMKATSICVALNWLAACFTVVIYSLLDDFNAVPYIFLFYGVVALGSVVYFKVDLIETKGLSPFQIYNIMHL